MIGKCMKKKRLISGVTLGLIVAMTISIPTIWAQSKQKSTHQWV